ncbi:MAG: hypothetical protein ABDI20_00985 [Candidatus Bipolaricaulaceae bacterium]
MGENMWTRLLLSLGLALFVSWAGAAWAWEAGADVGLVPMAYLNAVLEEAAVRTGGTAVPLRISFGGQAQVWPWPFLGLGVRSFSCAGSLVGRDERTLAAFALGIFGVLRFGLPLLGWPLYGRLEVGGLGGYASGLVEGWGLGWHASFGASLAFLRFWNLALGMEAGYRWAVIPALRTAREEIAPERGAALDFSGLFLGVVFRWEG